MDKDIIVQRALFATTLDSFEQRHRKTEKPLHKDTDLK